MPTLPNPTNASEPVKAPDSVKPSVPAKPAEVAKHAKLSESKKPSKKWVTSIVLVSVIALVGLGLWWMLRPQKIGLGFASGNGRVEAIELDVATKLAGRLVELMVDEGDFVTAGEVLAIMDTKVLEAQLSQAKANLRESESTKVTAIATVAVRESEKSTAEAVVTQRMAELTAKEHLFQRSELLVASNTISAQELDDNRAAMGSAQATLLSARSQVLMAQAGIDAANSQVIGAASGIEAAQAATETIAADIRDSQLKAPRSGRIQYRVSQVGEVLPAGGKVLNMIDIHDVYMTFFLPTDQAGRVVLGADVRLVLDALPGLVIPAKATYVANVAQFTPKTVETASEREKLMFRVKAHIAPELLQQHATEVKSGIPGMAYVKLDESAVWPTNLQIKATK